MNEILERRGEFKLNWLPNLVITTSCRRSEIPCHRQIHGIQGGNREVKGMHGLVGKTVVKVEAGEYDDLGDGRSIHEVYRITFTSGEVLHLMAEDGDAEDQYATIGEVEIGPDGFPSCRQPDSRGKWRSKIR